MTTIYKIVCTATSKLYVGKTTKSIQERFYFHCKDAEYGSNTLLHKAIRKYGKDAFEISPIEECLDEFSDDRECFWIKELNTFGQGYNLTEGGGGGDTSHSPNFKAALARRDMTGANNPMYGIGGMLGKNHRQESKDKQGASIKSLWDDPNSNYHKRSQKIEFEGTVYPSIKAARRATGRSCGFIQKHGTPVNA